MQVIKNRQIADINWQLHEGDQPVPDQGNIIVSYDFYKANRGELLKRSGETGILLKGENNVDLIAEDLDSLHLVAIDFGKFSDGRGYSHARLLRDKYKYQADILAIGDILRDQVADLVRCGINLIKFTDHRDIQDALQAFSEFSHYYQPATDKGSIINQLRQNQ